MYPNSNSIHIFYDMPNFLGEFLQEQQEPFSLQVYLFERGCRRGTSLNATSNFLDSAKILNRFGLKNRRHAIPNCSNFVKSLFRQLVSVKNNQKIKNPGNGVVFDSCAGSEVEVIHCSKEDGEADADRKLKWRVVEDNKQQLNPVSVLEETESDEVSLLHDYEKCNAKKTAATQGESSTSIYGWKLKRPTQELVNSYSQYVINKRALQQTKQLLIDCVREVIENYKKHDKRREHVKKILGAEELWKLVCENVWLWSQDSIHETNIIHLLHYDFLASAEEWSSDFKHKKNEIWMEIGDAILEDVINEIVTN